MRPLFAIAIVLPLALAGPSFAADPGNDFFEKKVRPVLVAHCLKCHSADPRKRKGGLALDSRAAMLKGGATGPAIVPGKPEDSLLIKAVRHDGELQMPPKSKLPAAVIADLEKWISLGAPAPAGAEAAGGPNCWAYQPPRRQPVPAVKDGNWPCNDIDRFLLVQQEAKGLRPVPDADRVTLLRRAYFDLIGLPPAPEEVDAFVNDPAVDAWEKVIDRLLASPHFGERWGRHWLDVARYADSSGGGRSLLFKDAWRYRDYVIGAFNDDRPYDQFVREQVAGDLLPATSSAERRRQLTATAFLALGPTNYEGQDKDVLEMDVIDEQLDTLGRAFLGQTVGCARCHDHKFDPIPTRDYYALAGIFKSTKTLIHDNVSRWVDLPLPLPPAEEKVVADHERAVALLKEKVRLAKEAEKKSGRTTVAKGVVAPKDLPGLVLDDAQAKKVGEWTSSKAIGNYIGDGYLHDGNADKGKKTLTFVPEFSKAGRYEVRLAYTPSSNRATNVPVHILHLDGEFTGHVNEQDTPPVDGRFVSLGTFRFDRSGQWYVIVSNEGTNGHVIVDAVQFLPADGAETKKPDPKPTGAPDSSRLEEELKKLEAGAPVRPLAMGVTEAAKVGDTYVCVRGVLTNRGESVPRGFLQVATVGRAPVIAAGASGRRELADWLARADNPLTARVMVNRVWHHLFGAGLVRTVDLFGATGEPPSHPELLDHLALQFVRDGWSIKRLVRSMVLSRAYRMSSAPNQPEAPARAEIDPENRLLWQMNRKRLEAECLSDAMLAVSGRLDRTAGGPAMKKDTVSEIGYVFNDVRRSVYLPVFRNQLPELFEVFDFADPNLVTGRRNVSTVPTQALYLMNNPFVMGQAKAAARRALAVPGDDAARMTWAYRTALGRVPTEGERAVALRFVAGKEGAARQAAWERVYQALFACIDFRYVY
jgi:Protein of unknown function (DUF1553)/Protein of unknown function (DUF1549)/Planctomycete cytochrome C